MGHLLMSSKVNQVDYPMDGNKVVQSLKDALQKAGIKDGITISSHHHFRNGDLVMNQVFDASHKLGVKGLRWFPSATFPCHAPIIDHMKNGTVDLVEGSLNVYTVNIFCSMNGLLAG